MKRLALLLMLIVSGSAAAVYAAPPENATKHMIPFPVICTPTMTEMMGALTIDYAVHISMTFEETPITGVIIVQNPNTNTAAILHISDERTCLIFSGLNMQLFDRPEGMAPAEESVQQGFKDS